MKTEFNVKWPFKVIQNHYYFDYFSGKLIREYVLL